MSQTNIARSFIASVICFCLSLALTAYTSHDPSIIKFGKAFFLETLAPLQSLNRTVHDGVGTLWDDYISLVDTKKTNERLLERLIVLEAENSRLLELAGENNRLKALLNVSEDSKISGPLAKVVAYDPTNWSKRITINRGSSDGVTEGMPVVSGNGVVGQIVSVGLHSAQVLLLSDPLSAVDALIQRTRTRGLIEGTGSSNCRLQYVRSEDDIKEGDRVITSGLDGVYPKGLLIGVVSKVGEYERGMLFRNIRVLTSINFDKLEDVMVVTSIPEKEDFSE